MLEPCFNELSVQPLCLTDDEVKNRVSTLSKLLSKLRSYGIKSIRIENGLADILLKEDFNLSQYCNQARSSEDRNQATMFYTMFHPPYLPEEKEDLLSTYSDVKHVTESGDEVNCYGLYIAHLLKSFAIGLNTGIKSPCKLKLITQNGHNKPKIDEVDIIHLSTVEQLNKDKTFAKFMSTQPDIGVKEVDSAYKKTDGVPEHHGIKECTDHGKKLLQNPYVKDILNSIDWNQLEKEYIHKVNPDGSIEIRLHWTKKGYGLLISTSATDLVEAYWVAKRLNEKYGKSKNKLDSKY